MLRPAFAIALPALGLAWYLSQTEPGQRAALAEAVRQRLGYAPTQAAEAAPAASPPVRAVPISAPVPSPVLGPDTYAVDADRVGQFETTMLVRGRQLPVLIDTGATFVALTFDDAASIGVHPVSADFKYTSQTANGVARLALVVLPSVRIGNVQVSNVQAVVSSPGALTGRSLLGMSFLRKLSGFEIQSGRLVLKQ